MRVLLAALTLAAVGGWHQAPPGGGPAATGTIAGTVIDSATGHPIDGAIVHIQPSAGTVTAPLQMTDPKGRYLFLNLPAGSFTLTASKNGYSAGAFGKDAESGITSRPIALEAGQHFPNATIYMARPSSISGIVTDERGEPMVNVFVRALRVVMMAGADRVASGRVVSTDDRGAYRLNDLAPGRYIVSLPSVSASIPASRTGEILAKLRESAARASISARLPRPDGALAGEHNYVLIAGPYPAPPGREPRAYPPLFHPTGRAIDDAIAISVNPGESRTGVNFAWAPVGASNVSGRLVGPADAVRGVLVRLTPVGSESLPAGAEAATTLTAADGSFTFLRVPHGEYTLIASSAYAYLSDGDGRALPRPPGFSEGWGGGASIPGSDVGYSYLSQQTIDTHTARQRVSVGGAAVNGLAVQLRPNVQLRGRVVIESGAFLLQGGSAGGAGPPVSGPVRAEPANADLTLGVPGGMFDSTTGRFSVDGLQPGEYVLRFMGLPPIKSITIGNADFTTKPIDTASGRDLDEIVITVTDKIATISGTVQTGAREAMPSVVIYFPTDREQWSRYGLRPVRIGSTSVTSSGSYRLELPAGEYFVIAVPAARNKLWQDPRQLEKIAVVATRVKVGWNEKRTENLTIKEVR